MTRGNLQHSSERASERANEQTTNPWCVTFKTLNRTTSTRSTYLRSVYPRLNALHNSLISYALVCKQQKSLQRKRKQWKPKPLPGKTRTRNPSPAAAKFRWNDFSSSHRTQSPPPPSPKTARRPIRHSIELRAGHFSQRCPKPEKWKVIYPWKAFWNRFLTVTVNFVRARRVSFSLRAAVPRASLNYILQLEGPTLKIWVATEAHTTVTRSILIYCSTQLFAESFLGVLALCDNAAYKSGKLRLSPFLHCFTCWALSGIAWFRRFLQCYTLEQIKSFYYVHEL